MAISSSLINTNTDTMTEDFDILYPRLASQTLKADVIHTFDGDSISIIWVPPTRCNTSQDAIISSIKCNTCRSFVSSYGMSLFQNDQTPFDFVENPKSDYYRMAHSKGYDMYQWHLVDTKVIGKLTSGVNPSTGLPWNHFHINLDDTTVGRYVKFSKKDYNLYFHQNLSIIYRLVEDNVDDGILDSLTLLLSILDDVPYGKTIRASTEWFYNVMKEYIDKYHMKSLGRRKVKLFYMKALVSAPLLVQHETKAYKIIYTDHLYQVKNHVIDALAYVNNITALKRLLTSRFSPSAFMRLITSPCIKRLKRAMIDFDGFNTTIMTLNEVVTTYGGVRVPSQSSDASVDASVDASNIFLEKIQAS